MQIRQHRPTAVVSRLVPSSIATGSIIPFPPVQADTVPLGSLSISSLCSTHIDSCVRTLPDIRQKGVYDTEKSGRECLVS